jgi:gas vesicle protein
MGQTTEELNAEIAGTRQSLADDLDALQDKVSPSAVVQRRKEAVSHRVRGLGSRIMGSARSSGSGSTGAVSSSGAGVRHAAGEMASTAEDRVEGSPLAAGLVAFGVGVVVAALLPPTEAESRASQTLVDTAKEQGGPVADAAKSAAREVGEGLRDKASQAATEVKESAQESAARVQDEASSSADRVRSESTTP